ncbi:MAG TPA: NADH:flavin oxidoreductase/NADH oxidase [Candidatus Baltobacteraceae bacterium]|nr:NADH:flavin oxidoreductase/NADH oxidase [Candidatus Baltobacteraceae bacterium]
MSLFEPLRIRGITLRNRIAVSPMCEYSSEDGFANQWHFVHLGSRAVGGAALVFTEASAVAAQGRISPADLGIYRDEHIPKLREIVDFIHDHGAVAGMQLAHAGFKASTAPPWEGGEPVSPAAGGWERVVAPSAIPFKEGWIVPHALDAAEITSVVEQFAAAARRALAAGFRVLEIHAAHGYLLHEFLSPITNRRGDSYGGSFENRTRIVREVVQAVREQMPAELPLFVRVSASDWVEGGWTVEDSAALARDLKPLGVDLIDASSGGIVPNAKIALGPGYQVPFARRIREYAGIATGAVGLITDAHQANEIVASGSADIVLIARELLRQPYWPLLAASQLGTDVSYWPKQYLRAKPR